MAELAQPARWGVPGRPREIARAISAPAWTITAVRIFVDLLEQLGA
ncbi:MAG TPA: hypothetical protein VF236_04045 [Gaiellaceae bacterium]